MILRQSSQEKICVLLFVSLSLPPWFFFGWGLMSLDVNYAGGDLETSTRC